MNRIQKVSPSGSYSLQIPADAEEDVDDRVSSFWVPGDDTLFQVSSIRRESGEQVSAGARLAARLARDTHQDVVNVRIEIVGCPDLAAASARDGENVYWLYTYAVWPDLTVFMTASHPERPPGTHGWAMETLHSLHLGTHEAPGCHFAARPLLKFVPAP